MEHCYRAQLQLYIFAKKSLEIDDIQTSIENTGFLHVFPNKGGLLVTFSIRDVRFAFISSHLTAHEVRLHPFIHSYFCPENDPPYHLFLLKRVRKTVLIEMHQ